jgi:hypothetical protein
MPRTLGAPSLALALTLACAPKQTGSDDGHTTTTQTATESGDADDTSTTSTSTSTQDTEIDTGDEGLTFVPMEDFAGLCSISELSLCDDFVQDCPEGEKCVPFHVEEDCEYPRCVTVTGDKQAGESCIADEMGSDDCDADSWCYPGTHDLELPPVCVAFCQGTADNSFCDDPSLTCVLDFTYQGPLGCRPSCDPLMPAGCEPWERCTFHNWQPAFGCVLGGGVANGEVCLANQQCDSGMCVLAEALLECAGERCCSPWCDLMAPNCAMGLECVPVEVDDPNPNVGVCSLP